MNYSKWDSYYKQILDDFNFSKKRDIESAQLLNDLLRNRNKIDMDSLKNFMENKEIVVFGAGPSLEKSIHKYLDFFIDKILISADGATSALVKNCILPDFIFTDLDGNVSDQIYANKNGSIIVLHAHGDNIHAIKKYLSKFNNRIIGTTQTDPSEFKNLYNFGGFTDGDRCVFFAEHFKVKKIYLIGFDFHGEIGEYSYPDKKDKKQKIKKLRWCEDLIVVLAKKHKNIIFL